MVDKNVGARLDRHCRLQCGLLWRTQRVACQHETPWRVEGGEENIWRERTRTETRLGVPEPTVTGHAQPIRKKNGIQFGKPVQGFTSATKGSGTAQSWEDWGTDCMSIWEARKAPIQVHEDGALCVERHQICYLIRKEVPFRGGHGRMQQGCPFNVKGDGEHMCVKTHTMR